MRASGRAGRAFRPRAHHRGAGIRGRLSAPAGRRARRRLRPGTGAARQYRRRSARRAEGRPTGVRRRRIRIWPTNMCGKPYYNGFRIVPHFDRVCRTIFDLRMSDPCCSQTPCRETPVSRHGVTGRFVRNCTLSRKPNGIRGFHKLPFVQEALPRRLFLGIFLSKASFKIVPKGNSNLQGLLSYDSLQIVQ